MSTAAAAVPSQLRIEMLRTDGIRPSPSNPRKVFKDIEALAENLKVHGIKVPLRVRPIAGDDNVSDHFELVFGERRWRAAKKAGLEEVPAIVEAMTDAQALELMLIELAQTSDVHPIEEAEAYRELHERHGMSPEEIALKVGKSKRTVYERLQLAAKATAPVKEASLRGDLSASIAVLVARVPAQHQEAALGEVLEGEFGGGPMTFEEAHDHILEKYTLGLADAPWDLKDEQLVAAAGSCTKCPKRTGNQPELFADVKVKDTCTDPECFGEKKKAFVRLTIVKAQEQGKPVLATAKEAKAAVKSGSHVELDKYDHNLGMTPRQAIGKRKIEATLAPAPEGVQELVRKEDLEKIVGKQKPQGAGHDWQAEQKKREDERRRKEAIAGAVAAEVAKKAEAKGIGKAAWFILAEELLDREFSNGEEAELLTRALLHREPQDAQKDLEEMKIGIAKLSAEQLPYLILHIVLVTNLYNYVNNGKGHLAEAARVFGVDEKKIAERVKAELKAAGKPGHVPPEPGAELPKEESAPAKEGKCTAKTAGGKACTAAGRFNGLCAMHAKAPKAAKPKKGKKK